MQIYRILTRKNLFTSLVLLVIQTVDGMMKEKDQIYQVKCESVKLIEGKISFLNSLLSIIVWELFNFSEEIYAYMCSIYPLTKWMVTRKIAGIILYFRNR